MSTKAQETMDTELIALAALANFETVCWAADNHNRIQNGLPPLGDGHGFGHATGELQQELYKRGYKV